MKITDYSYIVFVQSRSSITSRVTTRRRGFMTLKGANKYLRNIRLSSFVLDAWIN